MSVRIYTIDKLNANISAAKCEYEDYIFNISVDANKTVKVNVHNKTDHCKRIATFSFNMVLCVNVMMRDCDMLAAHLLINGIEFENEKNTEEEKKSVQEIKEILSNF